MDVLKLLKLFLCLVVFAFVFVVAFFGFKIYMEIQALKGGPQGGAAVAGAAESRGGDLGSIVADYRRAEEAAKLKPGDAANGVDGAAPVAVKPVPTPDPSQKIIREHAAGRKWVALTFDDGPNPQFSSRFLDVLRAKNARATFFLLGPNVKSNPEMAKAIVDAGFEVGNHTWKHPTLNSLSPEKVNEEIEKTNQVIKEATGVDVKLLRPPYGSANKKVQDISTSHGMTIVNWNIDTNDWKKGATAETMTSEVLKNLRDGSIILMHDRYEHTLQTTELLIDQIRAKGYQLVSVGELLGYTPYKGEGAAPAPSTVSEATPAPAVAEAPNARGVAPGGADVAAPETVAPAVEPSAPASATLPAPSLPAPGMAVQRTDSAPVLEVSPEKLTQAPVVRTR